MEGHIRTPPRVICAVVVIDCIVNPLQCSALKRGMGDYFDIKRGMEEVQKAIRVVPLLFLSSVPSVSWGLNR